MREYKQAVNEKSVCVNRNAPKIPLADTHLTHHEFITVVVTRQVGEDASSTCHNVNVIAAQQLDQRPQKTLHSLLVELERGGGTKKQMDESIPDEMMSRHHMDLYKKLPSWRRST